MEQAPQRAFRGLDVRILAGLLVVAVAAVLFVMNSSFHLVEPPAQPAASAVAQPVAAPQSGVAPAAENRPRKYQPRRLIDTSGFAEVLSHLRWPIDASLEDVRASWLAGPAKALNIFDRFLPPPGKSDSHRLGMLLSKVNVLNFQGEFQQAYEVLAETRSWVEQYDALAEFGLYTVIFFQGVTAMRRGETENCILCRGERSCILPIEPAAVHTNPAGSRLAIRHFTEYLEQFPDDLGVRWLLNLAHMTLGEYPEKVAPRYLLRLDHFLKSEFDLGKFRDIGDQAQVSRFSMNGGVVMEDFDNDGRLNLAVTANDPAEPMAYYHNAGDGTFEDRTKPAGLAAQLGGIHPTQTDYNNDGRMDLFISRGAWFLLPLPQSLLRNEGDGTFKDVTKEAGLLGPLNAMTSRWADYDNDGWIDVFIVCERKSNQLYRYRGHGTFQEVTAHTGLQQPAALYCKGADWIDYDNDDYPDLFVDNMFGDARVLPHF
jgi:hypothetical protein